MEKIRPALVDFPLAELDDVILMGFSGLERAGEGGQLPVLPGVGEKRGHGVELHSSVLALLGRGRLHLHQQPRARDPAVMISYIVSVSFVNEMKNDKGKEHRYR